MIYAVRRGVAIIMHLLTGARAHQSLLGNAGWDSLNECLDNAPVCHLGHGDGLSLEHCLYASVGHIMNMCLSVTLRGRIRQRNRESMVGGSR